jgi:hypothetical protein
MGFGAIQLNEYALLVLSNAKGVDSWDSLVDDVSSDGYRVDTSACDCGIGTRS